MTHKKKPNIEHTIIISCIGYEDVNDITEYFTQKATNEKNHVKQQKNTKNEVLDRLSTIAQIIMQIHLVVC